MSRHALWQAAFAAGLLVVIAFPLPSAEARPDLGKVPVVTVPSLDRAAIAAEDEQRDQEGLPPRFAIPNETLLRPISDGLWEDIGNDLILWRLRITSPGALSLNLGFGGYYMPPGGQLLIYAADDSYSLNPFTDADNADYRELWTPVVLSDDIVVEVTIPRQVQDQLVLELTSINVGYRGFAELASRAGACEIDVICPSADGWRNEIPAIAVYTLNGSWTCSGSMVNNTAQNQTPYFLTANHCGVTSGTASTMVVYWNFYSPTCGQHGGGSLSTYQTGATFRATWSTSDFTLVQLLQSPNPSLGITYAGWDRRDVNASSIVGIHHPNCDEKSISFSPNATFASTYLSDTSPGDGTHLHVLWLPSATNQGVTEPGSSGSPLFDQNHHILGQLHGGYSACGASDMRDWYGRFFRSWTGGGASSSRLSDWLDPGSTGAEYVDTLNPSATGMQVTPSDGLSSSGNQGGPFTPSSKDYTVHNASTTSINYTVGKTQSWVSLSSAGGALAGGASATVTVSINSFANSLSNGSYSDTVTFTNTTNHQGDTTRPVALQVGVPSLQYSFPMNINPGWIMSGGQWAFGQPTGGGGAYGSPDPTSGYTGANVYGYNLSGDYANSIPEYHLTTTAINCSNFTQTTLKFWRWLGVQRNTSDHAYVRISTDGTTWTNVWENPSTSTADAAWSQQSYDISAIADGHATVYLRWTMGATNSSRTYCGWNIDDVEIWGLSSAPATGACCQPNGSCTVTTQAACTGTWHGEWTSCSPNNCPQPTGACCQPNGSCTVTTQAACTGTWHGEWTSCSPNNCPQPTGACCQPDGSCTVTTQAACTGTWHGEWTSCSPNNCPQPVGACCVHGSCAIETEAECLANQGQFQGVGTTCTPAPCTCLGDSNCDGGINWRDIDYFVAAISGEPAWTAMFTGSPACPYANNDVNADGTVNWRDIDPFVGLMNAMCP